MNSDIEFAREYTLSPIAEIAARFGVPDSALVPYGRLIAKLDADFLASLDSRPSGKLILVTAINPTPAGEGKTTTTIGLGDALNRIGRRAMIALREPSLGPCFGQKGGATGGGRAQVAPMDEINLHFTGDFHAISTAHNLLAAMLDNHVYWGNALDIDARRVSWRRVMDMNDRALREITVGLGGVANGFPRSDGFDITVASEVMAAFCLSGSLAELEQRLGRMVVAETRAKAPVYARDLKAPGAMTALLARALAPNLVQTLEGSPALVHGGPFANIAHGCNSVVATRAALRLADYVVTEAGFGADLGAEKFFDIKCQQAGLKPDCAVIVATVRALKMNGGVAKSELGPENLAALQRGLPNLERHVDNIRKFGLEPIVAINRFDGDSKAELALVRVAMRARGVSAVVNESWGRGAEGGGELAEAVLAQIAKGTAAFRPLYANDMPLIDKIGVIAREIYRADGVAPAAGVAAQLKRWEQAGYGHLPICVAKTQYSFSADPSALGAPEGFVMPLREVRLRAGAGFVVAVMGEINAMPGLPRVPAAERFRVEAGRVEGLG
ncbi:MAG: formate--tetrahydrofolate ligase [Pseudomonadota bacterium]|nr:formate--tetrahydrofolate ligase [Pseudomonadota bacterium]